MNRKSDRPIINQDIKIINTNLPTKKSPIPDGFPGEFYQTLKNN